MCLNTINLLPLGIHQIWKLVEQLHALVHWRLQLFYIPVFILDVADSVCEADAGFAVDFFLQQFLTQVRSFDILLKFLLDLFLGSISLIDERLDLAFNFFFDFGFELIFKTLLLFEHLADLFG